MDVSVSKKIPGNDTTNPRTRTNVQHAAPDIGTSTHLHARMGLLNSIAA